MKIKVIIPTILLLVFKISSKAQDLGLASIFAPIENTTLYRGATVNALVSVENVGNQTIPANTTIRIAVDRGTVANGLKEYNAFFGFSIPPGNTITFSIEDYSIDFPTDNEPLTTQYTECFTVELIGDINSQNNTICRNFTASREPLDIALDDFELMKNGSIVPKGADIKTGENIDSIIVKIKNNTTSTIVPSGYFVNIDIENTFWGSQVGPADLQPGAVYEDAFYGSAFPYIVDEPAGTTLNLCISILGRDEDIPNNTLCKTYNIVDQTTSVNKIIPDIGVLYYVEGTLHLGQIRQQEPLKVEISNITGQILKQEIISGIRKHKISFQSYPKGVYFLTLYTLKNKPINRYKFMN